MYEFLERRKLIKFSFWDIFHLQEIIENVFLEHFCNLHKDIKFGYYIFMTICKKSNNGSSNLLFIYDRRSVNENMIEIVNWIGLAFKMHLHGFRFLKSEFQFEYSLCILPMGELDLLLENVNDLEDEDLKAALNVYNAYCSRVTEVIMAIYSESLR